MKRTLAIIGALVALAAFSWFFPLFHVVSRAALQTAKEQKEFRAVDYVKDFWTTKLLPALSEAADASTVIAAFHESPDAARTQFGRAAGLGRTSYYFLRGSGAITSVDNKQIVVALDTSDNAKVALAVGPLFGNTVRDATGLLNGSNFPNSQQFNEISAELNRTIEATVLPPLKERAKVGSVIAFVGCAEVTDPKRDLAPLKIVPLEVSFE